MKNIEQPIIIFGSGRSGTTIISEIFFRHEQLAWPSNYQEKFPAKPGINFLRNFFENSLWSLQGQKPQLNKVSKLNKILFKPAEAYNFWEYITGPRIDFSRGFLLDEKATTEEAKKIRTAFQKLVSYQSKQRLAFKITGPSRIGYLNSIFPDAVYIYITREPIPTINSWINVEFWQDKGKHQLWWTGAYSKEEEAWAAANANKAELLAAMQYRKLSETTAWEIEKYQVPCLTVRYEDFVQRPANTIEQMLSFTGLPASKAVQKYLNGINIYNQNKEESKGNTKKQIPYFEEIQQVLSGELVS